MQQYEIQDQHRNSGIRLKLIERLIYLPGAAIMVYGFWLALSV